MMKTAHFALILAVVLTANIAFCAGIQIPGYDVIHFKAGKIQQDVFFRNPSENPCCFKMSITLASGVPVWIAKGSNANSIGAGNGGTCGTVTIADETKVTQN